MGLVILFRSVTPYFEARRGMALVIKSALPTSLLPDDNFTPAVALGHPFPSIRQAIENFLKLSNGCAPYGNRILQLLCSSPCNLRKGSARSRPGVAACRLARTPSTGGKGPVRRIGFAGLDVVALQQ